MSASVTRSPENTCPLSTDQLSQLGAALREQQQFRTEQLTELRRSKSHTGPPTGDPAHDDIARALTAGAASALQEINAALDRMASGRFGVCVHCERPIAFQRLSILPMAASCIHCARARSSSSRPSAP